jgi:Ni2+-binding GTPase involved in maturation of urease and hydrogenase
VSESAAMLERMWMVCADNACSIAAAAGAGKTTLVNHILNEQRDLRICVIENEFGAVSVRQDTASIPLFYPNTFNSKRKLLAVH